MPQDNLSASTFFFAILLLGGFYLLCERLGFIGSQKCRERDDDRLFDDRDDGDGGDGGDGGGD